LHLLRQQGETSVAIDLFEDQSQNLDRSGLGDEGVFRENLEKYAGGDAAVTVVQADSTTLTGAKVRDLAAGPVRLFSVDGGHTAEIVEHDMRTASESLVDGGIVIGDDVFNAQWPGAVEGTLAYLDSNQDVVPFAIGFNKVLFCAPAFADAYRAVVLKTARRRLWNGKESVFRGHPVAIIWPATAKARGRRLAKRVLRRS
jgi:hypothetical protein